MRGFIALHRDGVVVRYAEQHIVSYEPDCDGGTVLRTTSVADTVDESPADVGCAIAYARTMREADGALTDEVKAALRAREERRDRYCTPAGGQIMTSETAKKYQDAMGIIVKQLKSGLADSGMDERQRTLLSALSSALCLSDALGRLAEVGE